MIKNIRKTEIFLDNPIDKILAKRIAPYEFQVGILNDRPHYAPKVKKDLKSFAGGPARRKSNRVDGTLSSVGKDIRTFLGFNYLTKPFEKRQSDLIKFVNQFFRMAFSESNKVLGIRRCENLLQAVVRNPMLRGDYGRNTRAWAKIKGFNRKLIDTGQFFDGIEARVRIKNVSK